MAGLVDILVRHEQVGFDTSVFIYRLSRTARYITEVSAALEDLQRGSFRGVTSVVTLTEIIVQPLQLGQPLIAAEYRAFIENFPHLTIAEIDRPVALHAAELRAAYRLRPIDALHIAACLRQGATAFLTNDKDLGRVTELQIILLDDFTE